MKKVGNQSQKPYRDKSKVMEWDDERKGISLQMKKKKHQSLMMTAC